MRITLDIPEEEYKRYKQYYDPYIISDTIQSLYDELHTWAIENCSDNPHVCDILERIENQ